MRARRRRSPSRPSIAHGLADERYPNRSFDQQPRGAAQLALGGVFGAACARARHRDRAASARSPIPRRCSATSRPRSRTRRGSPGRWSGAAGWSAGPGADAAAGARRIRAGVLARGARPRRRGIAPGLRRARAARGVRRLLWLGQRRALSRRAAPDPPLSEPRRRLCPLGQQLQLGRGGGDPAACHRPARRRSPATTSAGPSWSAESALVLAFGGMALKNNDVGGGGTSQHVARDRLRRGAPARRRISPDRPAARRSAGRGRGGLAPDPPRHRCRADAGAGAHAGRRGAARPRLSRPLLRRLGGVRGLSARPRRRSAEGCGLGRGDLRHSGGRDRRAGAALRPDGARSSPARNRLQRAEHGEQPVWMGVVLAAMLGQIGLPGGGFAYALGSTSNTGKPPLGGAAADPADRPQQHRRFHPGGAHRRHAAAIRASRSTTTASGSPIPTSGWSTGPAATRSTTTRI